MARPDDPSAPLDLGTVTPGSPDSPGEQRLPPESAHAPAAHRAPWRQWAAIGAALAVGVGIGAVVNETRDDAADLSDVTFAGTVVGPPGDLPNGELGALAIRMVNLGPTAVEVVGVSADGFLHSDDAERPDPVEAEPGRWVQFETSAVPDCTAEPSDDVEIQVRTEAGQRSVPLSSPPDAMRLSSTWSSACRQVSWDSGLSLNVASVTAPADGQVVTQLQVSTNGSEPGRVIGLSSATAGFASTVDELPMVLSTTGTTTARMVWTVEDCPATTSFRDASVKLEAVGGGGTSTTVVLDGAVAMQLVRLAERQCGRSAGS